MQPALFRLSELLTPSPDTTVTNKLPLSFVKHAMILPIFGYDGLRRYAYNTTDEIEELCSYHDDFHCSACTEIEKMLEFVIVLHYVSDPSVTCFLLART